MNPYFVAYANAHGRTPEAQLRNDRWEWPGARMTGFILWISKKKAEFYEAHRECFLDRWAIADTKAWGRFLQGQAEEEIKV